MALAEMLYMCVLHLIMNDVHAKSYPHRGTWGIVGGGGGGVRVRVRVRVRV